MRSCNTALYVVFVCGSPSSCNFILHVLFALCSEFTCLDMRVTFFCVPCTVHSDLAYAAYSYSSGSFLEVYFVSESRFVYNICASSAHMCTLCAHNLSKLKNVKTKNFHKSEYAVATAEVEPPLRRKPRFPRHRFLRARNLRFGVFAFAEIFCFDIFWQKVWRKLLFLCCSSSLLSS